MFISAYKQWCEVNDPYGLQRMVLPKAFFVATISTYVYWLFLPIPIQSFFAVFFVMAYYESPALTTFAEKERLLGFIALVLILISISFYLVYPFKGTFFFFSILVLALTYFSVLKYFYALKNLTMLLLVNGTLILSIQPQANFQVAYEMVFSITLAVLTVFIAVKVYPNRYLTIWNNAMQKFVACLENNIEAAIAQTPTSYADEVMHLGMARNYRRLLPKQCLFSAQHFSVNLRRIEHSLDSIYYDEKNEVFWMEIKAQLIVLRGHMPTLTPCLHLPLQIPAQTTLQRYVLRCLSQALRSWNYLCTQQKK